jgi:hypothetical protein
MDLMGPFRKAPEGFTHLLVMVDARPLAKIGSKQVVSFVQDIFFHFRLPNYHHQQWHLVDQRKILVFL